MIAASRDSAHSLPLLNDRLSSAGAGISGVALSLPGESFAGSSALATTASSNGLASTPLQPNLSSIAHISDPFSYSMLPSSSAIANNALHPSMLLLQPNSTALLQSLKTGHNYRTAGGRTKAGYPPNGLVIPPGTYAVFGKSLTALNGLRTEEIADDLEGFRFLGKKRKRGGENRGVAQKKAAMQEAF